MVVMRVSRDALTRAGNVARIQTVRRDPGVRVSAKLAKGLGVPLSELYTDVHAPGS